MPAFKKGHKKVGGRKKGVPNKSTTAIREMLNDLLPPEKLRELWKKALTSRKTTVQLKAFELANHYLFGKPTVAVAGEELGPPIRVIDMTAVKKFREPVKQIEPKQIEP